MNQKICLGSRKRIWYTGEDQELAATGPEAHGKWDTDSDSISFINLSSPSRVLTPQLVIQTVT
jgi:hypothetical protein